jgi:lipopolysaccharide transport system ATP-binding protein
MSTVAIQVESLGKEYRIGKRRTPVSGRRKQLTRLMMGSFDYLASTLRKPAPDEVLWALKDVSFEIKQGEAVGIIGKNGAGKSTLLKLLSRITAPSTGRATIHGRIGSLLEVGTGFHPELTGRENIYLNGAILGMKRREIARLFDEIVAFAEVETFVDTPVKRYSSGMYVRLAFAVAAHLEPEVMVVDEVLAVGDAAFQKRCLGKMEDVANQGRTVLFVSHNMAAITQFCHRAIWLERGQLRMTGQTWQVVKSYLSDGSANRAERLWSFPGDAPGDNRVRLLAVRIKQRGEITNIVDINQPCQIEIDFQTLEPARNLISGVNLYNEEGICLFTHCDWRPNELGANRYRKQVELPAQLLAEGSIRVLVQLVFYEPDIPSVILPDALQFDAADSDHPLTVRGHWKGDWPGVVRVGLQWSDAQALDQPNALTKAGSFL